jgi:hypothetical protein
MHVLPNFEATKIVFHAGLNKFNFVRNEKYNGTKMRALICSKGFLLSLVQLLKIPEKQKS